MDDFIQNQSSDEEASETSQTIVKKTDKKEEDKWKFKRMRPYEFTISPIDNLTDKSGPPGARYVRIYYLVKRGLEEYFASHQVSYYLKAEIGHGNRVYDQKTYPRWHFHGYLVTECVTSLLNSLGYVSKKIGRITLNPLRPEHWAKYINKEHKHIKAYAEQRYYSRDPEQPHKTGILMNLRWLALAPKLKLKRTKKQKKKKIV